MNPEDLKYFVYVGCGYFRDRRVPIGEKSKLIHAPELLEYILKKGL